MDSTPDLGDNEVDGQRLVSVYATVFLLAVYVLSAGLDVADLFWSIVAPQSVAKLGCLVRPLALIAVPFSSLPTISDACLGEFRYPVISLTFFSVKLTMAFIAFVLLWVCWKPDGFRAARDIYLRRFKAPGGYRKELKSFAKNSSGMIVFLTCCFLLASISAADPKASFILGSKFVVEDGLAAAIPVLAMNFIARVSVFGFFAWTHRNSGSAAHW
jgi:hypothetical protein